MMLTQKKHQSVTVREYVAGNSSTKVAVLLYVI